MADRQPCTHPDPVVAVIADQVADIHRRVCGNGQPGLEQRMSALESRWAQLIAVMLFITSAAGLYAAFK